MLKLTGYQVAGLDGAESDGKNDRDRGSEAVTVSRISNRAVRQRGGEVGKQGWCISISTTNNLGRALSMK